MSIINNNNTAHPAAPPPLADGFVDSIHWNEDDKDGDVSILSEQKTSVLFHREWSHGTAAVRANKPVNKQKGRYYFEVKIEDRIFGTSMMVGLTTRQTRLSCHTFLNLIGENEFGWGLSHKGLLWHKGRWKSYTNPFHELKTVHIGCLYDGFDGTLTFFKNGRCLGVAYRGLNAVKHGLYPTICSTAADTKFSLVTARRDYIDLQDRCRSVIRLNVLRNHKKLDNLPLPRLITSYIKLDDERGQSRDLPPLSLVPPRTSETSASIDHLLGLCGCPHTDPPCDLIEIVLEPNPSPPTPRTPEPAPEATTSSRIVTTSSPMIITGSPMVSTSSPTVTTSNRIVTRSQTKKRSMPNQNHPQELSDSKRTKIPRA